MIYLNNDRVNSRWKINYVLYLFYVFYIIHLFIYLFFWLKFDVFLRNNQLKIFTFIFTKNISLSPLGKKLNPTLVYTGTLASLKIVLSNATGFVITFKFELTIKLWIVKSLSIKTTTIIIIGNVTNSDFRIRTSRKVQRI